MTINDMRQLIRDWNHTGNLDTTLGTMCHMAGLTERFIETMSMPNTSERSKALSELAERSANFYGLTTTDNDLI